MDALREDCVALDPVIQCRLFQMLIEYFKVLRSTFKLGVRINRPATAGRAFSVCSFDATLNRRQSQIQTPLQAPTLDRFSQRPGPQNDLLQNTISQITNILQSRFSSSRDAYTFLDQSQAGYISISMLRVRLESLGVPPDLTNQPCFIQYLQQLCPKRLITIEDFSDMFPLLNTQRQTSNSIYDSFQNTGSFDSRRPSSAYQQPYSANQPQVQYTPSRPGTAMTYQSEQQQPAYQPSNYQQNRSNPPADILPVHSAPQVPRQTSFTPAQPEKFLDDRPAPPQEKYLDNRPMNAPQQAWTSAPNDLQATIDPFQPSKSGFEKNRDAELASAMKQTNKSVIQLFNEYKASGDSAVTQESLAKKMKEIGIECDDQTCLNLIRQFDTNGDDKLHLLEWEVLCKALLGQDHIDRLIRNQCKIETSTPNYPPNHHLKYVTDTLIGAEPSISTLFKKMCVSGARRCSIADMHQGLQQYGIYEMTMQDVAEMIAPFDKTNQGSLSRGEFIRFINAGKL